MPVLLCTDMVLIGYIGELLYKQSDVHVDLGKLNAVLIPERGTTGV